MARDVAALKSVKRCMMVKAVIMLGTCDTHKHTHTHIHRLCHAQNASMHVYTQHDEDKCHGYTCHHCLGTD